MDPVKTLHVATALISITGFTARGLLKLRQSPWLKNKWFKILPHLNDTILLITAISLVISHGYAVTQQPWLIAKIAGLLLYIAAGMIFMRMATSLPQKLLSFFLAILLFCYIVAVAIEKSPLPFV